jgi:hypothetical protein
VAHAKLNNSLQMKTMFIAEASHKDRRSGPIQTSDPMPIVTAGNPLEEGGMNPPNRPVDRTKIGLGIALLAAFTGCVGYVDGGYYGGPVVVPGPAVYFYGGGYERGHDVRVYSHRGAESRAVAHPGGRGGEDRRR